MSAAHLHTVFATKPFGGVPGAIFGYDVQRLFPAPFGDVVRVSFDRNNVGVHRERAQGFAVALLPIREGFRHFVIEDDFGSFVVFLGPNEDRNNDVILSKFHSAYPFLSRHSVVSQPHLDEMAKGRPSVGDAA